MAEVASTRSFSDMEYSSSALFIYDFKLPEAYMIMWFERFGEDAVKFI